MKVAYDSTLHSKCEKFIDLNYVFFVLAGQMFPSNGLARYTKLGEPDELLLSEEYAKELLGRYIYH